MKIYFISLVSLFSLNSLADQRFACQLQRPDNELTSGQCISGELNEKSDLSVLGFTLEQATLIGIQNILGKATLKKSGDASTSNTSICYVGADKTAVRFNSNELGGGETLTSIEIVGHLAHSKTDCASSARIDKNIGNLRGFHLALTPDEVYKHLGEPSLRIENSEWLYKYETKQMTPGCSGGWDKIEVYKFKFGQNKIRYISIAKTTSC